MKKLFMYISILLLSSLTLQSCSSSNDEPTPPNLEEPEETDMDWQTKANQSSNALIDFYWNKEKNFFNYYPSKPDTPNEDWHYWPQAHAMDVLIDAYMRTGDSKWKQYFSLWHEGVKQKSGGSYFNDFVDDMEWICLTMIRLYESTKETKYMETAQLLWGKIKTQWNNQAGGGIAWKQSQPWSKNACSNGPAGIIAARMYQLNGNKKEDLDWAQKIYNWQSETLLNLQTGAIYDNINANTGIVTEWLFTYNQGTYMGMSHELYKITGEEYYLDYACKAANYCLQNLIDQRNNILKDEGKGDGGLFKGIFIRYFVRLILEEDLEETTRKRYLQFFNNNAKVLVEKGSSEELLYSSDWATPGNFNNDMPTQVSGCTMIEAKAYLEAANNTQHTTQYIY